MLSLRRIRKDVLVRWQGNLAGAYAVFCMALDKLEEMTPGHRLSCLGGISYVNNELVLSPAAGEAFDEVALPFWPLDHRLSASDASVIFVRMCTIAILTEMHGLSATRPPRPRRRER